MDKNTTQPPRWLLLILGIIIFMCLGSIYSWSVFRKPLEDLLNIDPMSSGLPYMLFLAFYALLMPLTSGMIDKYGPRVIIFVGGFIVGAGWFLSGFAQNIIQLSITYGIIAGGGVGIVYGAPIATISRWFPEKRGFVVGMNLAGFGLSPIITAPVSEWMIERFGPLYTFHVFGLIFLFVIPILSLPFKFPPSLDSNRKIETATHPSIRDIIRQPLFRGLWLCLLIGTFIGLMAIGITSPVAEEIIRLNPVRAAWFISFFAICNASGRPLFGWLTDRYKPLRASIISYSMIILAAMLMLLAKDQGVVIYFLSFSLLWMNLGGWLAIAPVASSIFFTKGNHTRIYSYIFTAYGVGAIIGVVVSGEIRRLTGTYLYAFFPIAAMAILGIITALYFFKSSQD